ncbi:hypothetical protein AKJ16_DCAP21582 [Drosera capensis]
MMRGVAVRVRVEWDRRKGWGLVAEEGVWRGSSSASMLVRYFEHTDKLMNVVCFVLSVWCIVELKEYQVNYSQQKKQGQLEYDKLASTG